MGFACEADARRVMEVLPKRFSKYGLTIHPDKTRLVPFLRPVTPGGVTGSESRPGTFDFLGFTHYWGRSRKGSWIVKRQTAANRLRRATMKVAAWCRRNRHRPIPEQHEALSRKLHGHYAYGFRPGRSAHQALQALWQQLAQMGGGWVLDVDVRKFFDTLGHSHLRALIRRRVRDGVLLRLIDKWLSAGVLDEGELSYPEAGSPQGGVISPVLSNIYLHYVLDDWFEQVGRPRLRGHAFLIRYSLPPQDLKATINATLNRCTLRCQCDASWRHDPFMVR